MKLALRFGVSLLVAVMAAPSIAQDYHSTCDDTSEFYRLDGLKLVSGDITLTEVSIAADDKLVCVNGVADRRLENSETVEVMFTNSMFSCVQHEDRKRISAARLTNSPYKVVGKFHELNNGDIVLKNCDFEDF